MKSLFAHYLDSFHLDRTSNGQEFLSLSADIRSHPAFIRLGEFSHHYSVSRQQHVTSVAYLTYLVCLERGLASRAACRAALLHDLFYYDRQHRGPRFLYFRHPKMALKAAAQLGIEDALHQDIILHHMWPLTYRMPKTAEGRIVCYLDKYCAIHEFLASRFPCLYQKRRKAKGISP